jgi:hypothetical protein
LQELFQTAQKKKQVFLELEENPHLHGWLNRLSSMADYRAGGEHRERLARTVLLLLEAANEDPKFREVFLAVIEEATKTCGDRMALSLLHLGIQYQIAKAPKDDPIKVATLLIRGPMILDLLAKIAQEKVATMQMVDPIEVYLAYPVKLQEELQIPIDVKEMRYFSGIKEKDFAAAKAQVEQMLADQEALNLDLIQRQAWIETLSHQYPEEVEALKKAREAAFNEELCDYSQAIHHFQEGLLELTRKALHEKLK